MPRNNRASRRYKDANGKFVFIKKPNKELEHKMDYLTRVHVRSYRADEPMPKGFSMKQVVDLKGVSYSSFNP